MMNHNDESCIWIGLFRDSWKWSDQTNTSSSLRWAEKQPDNSFGSEICAAVDEDGWIADELCSEMFFFFCKSPWFLSIILCGSREYILIEDYKTWDEAQDYCRQNYIDLATVQSDEEWNELTKLIEKLQFYIWIGLYDDVNTWHWSYQDESVTFLQWDSEQPNNLNGKQYCVNLRTNGYWWDEACNLTCTVFCQSGEGQPVLVTDPEMSWNKAQHYCRENYTDLFTIRNMDVNQQLTVMIQDNTCAWIGLFRDSWKWSDQTSTSSSLRWAVGQPDNSFGQDSCAALDYDGRVKHQILRLEVKAGDNVNDPAITTTVLNKDRAMDQNHLLILMSCGIHFVTGPYKNYYFVNESKTFAEARRYCRENHIDLVTVEDWTDMEKLLDLKNSMSTKSAWIGLRKTHHQQWCWALPDPEFYKDGETEYRNWRQNEPTNLSDEYYSVMDSNGY
ncbi:hypothetical protein cypCar_00035611 [Cyprinus carpio]|nr:hypothetical protein cypCar_00035611 [Cyprinus carpio]